MKLCDFDHLRSDKRVKFKEEIVDGVSFTIVAYSIADSAFWQKPLALETRGITFNTETGDCVSRPFEKFFNLNENEWSQEKDVDFAGMIVHDKRDGSMVHPVIVRGEFYLKTKKSFFSDVAIKATKIAPGWVKNIAFMCEREGFTPIFEFTHPEHQIVVNYGDVPTFKLLAVRDNETGEYLSRSSQIFLFEFAEHNSIIMDANIETLKESVNTAKNIEGYVLHLRNGKRLKLKTQWYEQNHRIMTDLRERDIARMVISENVDDLKASLAAEGKSIQPVVDIENRVVKELADFYDECYNLLEKLKAEPTRKDAAMKYGKNEFFPYAMVLYTGGEIDSTEVFKKRMLGKYTLRVVYNPSFSGDVE